METDELAGLRSELMILEREYNSTRQELFSRMRSYYNQSIGSNVIKEDELRRLVNQCEEIKQLYHGLQSDLMAKRTVSRPWSFRDNFNFKK